MELGFIGTFQSGAASLDANILDFCVLEIGGGLYLYTVSGAYGGIAVYALESGAPTLIDSAYYTDSSTIDYVAPIVISSGTPMLVYGSSYLGRLLGYSLDGVGEIGLRDSLTLPAGAPAGFQSAAAALDLPGGEALFLVDDDTGDLYSYFNDGTGWDLSAGPFALQVETGESGDAILETVRIGTATYLIATTSFSDMVQTFQVSEFDGTLRAVDTLGKFDGVGINTPTAMEIVEAFGKTWILLGAAESGSISVMSLAADGTLSATDHLLDTLETRFDGVTAMASVTIGDRVFVIAGGSDDGISLFTLLPNGVLVHLKTLVHATGLGLENVAAIEAALVGDSLQIFVASALSPGVALFEIDLATLGVTKTTSGTTATTLSGGAGNDMLVSTGDAADTLLGGAGSDILVSGGGAVVMTGGAGSDLFVIGAGIKRQVITDFERGLDRLDLTNWPMLRNTGQLTAWNEGNNLILAFDGHVIEIRPAGSYLLRLSDILPGASLGAPDHALLSGVGFILYGTEASERMIGGLGSDSLLGESGGDTLFGNDGDDVLFGGDGDDLIWGGEGNDELFAEAGADTIEGEDGDDWINGGEDNDLLQGGLGNDYLDGSSGDDVLYGSAGADTLDGGVGNDTLYGGNQGDSLRGGHGLNLLYGGNGNDTLSGGRDADTLYGEAGADAIWGGGGRDYAEGGDGDDRIGGMTGADTLYGDAGNDTLWGGTLNDELHGGADNDLLAGGEGGDLLYGDDGNDTLEGGSGIDILWGGTGDDLLQGGTYGDQLHGDDGADTLEGEDGRDRLWGDAGDDLLDGGAHNDKIYGGADNDTLLGGDGKDTLDGEDGNDLIDGGEHDDGLWGGTGDDTILGGGGNDRLGGQDGADVLYGGLGDDTLWGGLDADVFEFSAGTDEVRDFVASEDVILFSGDAVGITDLADLLANHAAEIGADLHITDDLGNVMILVNTTLADLNAANTDFS